MLCETSVHSVQFYVLHTQKIFGRLHHVEVVNVKYSSTKLCSLAMASNSMRRCKLKFWSFSNQPTDVKLILWNQAFSALLNIYHHAEKLYHDIEL